MPKSIAEFCKDGTRTATLIKYEKILIGSVTNYLLTFEDGSQWRTASHNVTHQLEMLTQMKVQLPIEVNIGYVKITKRINRGKPALTLSYPNY